MRAGALKTASHLALALAAAAVLGSCFRTRHASGETATGSGGSAALSGGSVLGADAGKDNQDPAVDGSGPDSVGIDPVEVVETQVWAGVIAATYGSLCNQPPPTGPATDDLQPVDVVMVIDLGAEGRAVAASLLFGHGDPPAPSFDEPIAMQYNGFWMRDPVLDCRFAPFEGFEYVARDLADGGSRLLVGISTLDVYGVWCAEQPPLPVPETVVYALPVSHTCRPWAVLLPDPSSIAERLCISNHGDMPCRCTALGCEIQADLVYADLVRTSDHTMDGVISIFFKPTEESTRILLERIR